MKVGAHERRPRVCKGSIVPYETLRKDIPITAGTPDIISTIQLGSPIDPELYVCSTHPVKQGAAWKLLVNPSSTSVNAIRVSIRRTEASDLMLLSFLTWEERTSGLGQESSSFPQWCRPGSTTYFQRRGVWTTPVATWFYFPLQSFAEAVNQTTNSIFILPPAVNYQ